MADAGVNPWVVALPAIVTGVAAIVAGYLAGYHQAKGQREDRQEERRERRRDARENDLRGLQELTGTTASVYAKAGSAVQGPGPNPSEVLQGMLTTATAVYATVARLGDDDLAAAVEVWMGGLMNLSRTGNSGPNAMNEIRAVHDRIGQMIRELDE